MEEIRGVAYVKSAWKGAVGGSFRNCTIKGSFHRVQDIGDISSLVGIVPFSVPLYTQKKYTYTNLYISALFTLVHFSKNLLIHSVIKPIKISHFIITLAQPSTLPYSFLMNSVPLSPLRFQWWTKLALILVISD